MRKENIVVIRENVCDDTNLLILRRYRAFGIFNISLWQILQKSLNPYVYQITLLLLPDNSKAPTKRNMKMIIRIS